MNAEKNRTMQPLTTAEIERLGKALKSFDAAPRDTNFYECANAVIAIGPRLLAMLTPPADAEVREAILSIKHQVHEQGVSMPQIYADDIRTLLRAVRAPRLTGLTGEQESVLRMLYNAAEMRDAFRDEPGQALAAECRAVFPSLAGKEG